jgi:hypothetical protein
MSGRESLCTHFCNGWRDLPLNLMDSASLFKQAMTFLPALIVKVSFANVEKERSERRARTLAWLNNDRDVGSACQGSWNALAMQWTMEIGRNTITVPCHWEAKQEDLDVL